MKHFSQQNVPLMSIGPKHGQNEHKQHIAHKLHARSHILITNTYKLSHVMSKPPSHVSTSRYETSHWLTSCNGLAPKIRNLTHLWHGSKFFKHRHLTYHFHDWQIKHGTWSAFAAKKKLRLLHKVACRLNIHDGKRIFDPKWKEHGSKHKLRKI
jgi:hypothetical protein